MASGGYTGLTDFTNFAAWEDPSLATSAALKVSCAFGVSFRGELFSRALRFSETADSFSEEFSDFASSVVLLSEAGFAAASAAGPLAELDGALAGVAAFGAGAETRGAMGCTTAGAG